MTDVEKLAQIIGEGVHTGLRKFCQSKASWNAHQSISQMPDSEWEDICREVARMIVEDKG